MRQVRGIKKGKNMENIVYREKIKNFRKPFFLVVYAKDFIFLIVFLFIIILLKENNLVVLLLIIFIGIPVVLRTSQIGPQLIPWYQLKIDNQKIEIRLYEWQAFRRVKWFIDLKNIDNIQVINITDAKLSDLPYMFWWPFQNRRNVERIIMGNGPAIKIYTKENKEFIFSTDNPHKVKQSIEELALK